MGGGVPIARSNVDRNAAGLHRVGERDAVLARRASRSPGWLGRRDMFTSRIRAKYAGTRGSVCGHDADEALLVGLGDQRVGGTLGTKGRGVARRTRRAEGPGAVRWQQHRVVGQVGERLVDRVELRAGEGVGEARTEEIGPGRSPAINAPPLQSSGGAPASRPRTTYDTCSGV